MTRAEVSEVLMQALQLKELKLEDAMGKTRNWDSLAHVALLLTLEERTGCEVPPDMFGKLTSVCAIFQFLEEESLLDP